MAVCSFNYEFDTGQADEMQGNQLTLEVAQHLGENIVRCIAMDGKTKFAKLDGQS